ncbi:queuosine precursor transporter [bacterium]|nr:queuosine precursor transporter [bacterium]
MKKNEKNLSILYMVFAALLVCSNCIAAKQVPIGTWFGLPISITAGIICYPLTFLITDVIGEIWGKKEAQRAVVGGFIGQIITIILIIIANSFTASDPAMKDMFNSVLGSNWILTVGSLAACLLSQMWDVQVFHKIRNSYIKKHGSTKGGKWIWNNASTISSQLIDSVVFYIGLLIMLKTQGITLPFNVIVVTIFAYWIIKTIIALLDTPFFYFFTRKADKN